MPTPTSTTPAPHITSDVSLTWFGMADLPGYIAHERNSLPGYQSLALRRISDSGNPIGCNGCELASVYVDVFEKGHFDPTKNGITSGEHVTVGGVSAEFGDAAYYGAPEYRVPSIAWQFRPGEWVLVQGVTPLGSTRQALLTVAAAVRPAQSVPIGLPCMFGYLPPLPIVSIFDDRSEGYAFELTMGDVSGRSFTITLWNGTGWPYYDPTGMAHQSIGGLPGYYGPQQGAGVLYHGGGLAFGFAEAATSPTTPVDNAETQRVIAGLQWANGDGRAPAIPAVNAIP